MHMNCEAHIASLLAKYLVLSVLIIPFNAAYALEVSGWVEKVELKDGFALLAKIDTGADNSSINAVNPDYFDNNGEEWVKFNLENSQGDRVTIEKPVLGETRIKMKNGGIQTRKVIQLTVCMGAVEKTISVNLVDRKHFKYQMLIGRSFLANTFLVDSGKKFITTAQCSN